MPRPQPSTASARERTFMITDAISLARNEHVLFFLLTSYVEARVYQGRFDVPEGVKVLPLQNEPDLDVRMAALRDSTLAPARAAYDSRCVHEALTVFTAAKERLTAL